MRVAEAKSLAAAAHVMEVSPSSVSKVIAGLEKAVGFSLFHRSTRRLNMVVAASPHYLERFGEPSHPTELEQHRWALPARVDEFLGSSPHWEFFKGKVRCPVTAQSYVTMRDSIGLPESAVGGVGIV